MLQALRDSVSIDRSVLFEQPQPPLRIAAIRGAALFSRWRPVISTTPAYRVRRPSPRRNIQGGLHHKTS
jgi:hypothetical protein